jgi:hypothetical protein
MINAVTRSSRRHQGPRSHMGGSLRNRSPGEIDRRGDVRELTTAELHAVLAMGGAERDEPTH